MDSFVRSIRFFFLSNVMNKKKKVVPWESDNACIFVHKISSVVSVKKILTGL